MSRRVFITGGASGLGRALARRYARVERRRFYVLPHCAGAKAWMLKRLLPRRAYRALVLRKATRSSR
jgi:NAD(P)-dependent dehydrogenase (short-subunit alcohol dehydrogenase family)